jgi:hypothetical protein
MKHNIRFLTILTVLLGVLALPGAAFAQDDNPDDATILGGDYTLEAGERLDTVLVLGGNVTLEPGSVVEDHITILGGNVTIAGEVKNDIQVFGGNLDLATTSHVNGDIRMVGGNISQAEGSEVDGRVSEGFSLPFHINLPDLPRFEGPFFFTNRNPFARSVFDSVGKAIGLSLLAMLVILVAPDAVRRAGSTAVRRPVEAGGVGLLVAILTPILLIGFAITLIGIPVTILLAILAALLLAYGWVALGVETGRRLAAASNQDWQPVLQAGIGTFLLALVAYAMEQTPFIGWIVPVLVGFVGMGGVLLSRFGTRIYPPAQPPVTPSPA